VDTEVGLASCLAFTLLPSIFGHEGTDESERGK
jgi:hypothetical protein